MHLNLFSKGSAASTQAALTMIQIRAEISNVAIQQPSTKHLRCALAVFNSCTMTRATSGNNTVLQSLLMISMLCGAESAGLAQSVSKLYN